MSLRSTLFDCKTHEDYDSLGWVMCKKSYFDPAQGRQVAHDLLEEFPRGQDQPHDEFMALGAAIWGRGQGGYFQYRSAAYNIAGDFTFAIGHAFNEDGYYLRNAPRTYKLRDWDAEAVIEEIGQIVLESGFEDIYDDDNRQRAIDYVSHALNWMRIGYRRAAQRFRVTNHYEITAIFNTIEKEVDKILKWSEEGDKLKVMINLRTRTVKVEHIPYSDPYAY